MLQNPCDRRWCGLALMVAVMIGLLATTAGCNPLNFLGGINLNIVIPLGLDGDAGVFNPSGDSSAVNPDDDDTTNPPTPTPPVGDITSTNGTTN